MTFSPRHSFITGVALFGLTCAAIGVLLLAGSAPALAQTTPENPTFHPTFALLDAQGQNVLDSGEPVSTMQTCGTCHDTAFIARHSGHADAGYGTQVAAGSVPGGQPWETSTAFYGGWDPITYRYLSPEGDARVDLTPQEWVQVYGGRHVGGGPAEAAAGVEMNCFLCHTAAPDGAARAEALATGDFDWANSAVLQSTGIVVRDGAAWRWSAESFNADGTVREDIIGIGDPTDLNCGQCHGLVHADARAPLATAPGDVNAWNTLTTGQVYSPQRLSFTGLNLENKSSLGRSWDVHAERVVGCTDCHYALNNPVFDVEAEVTRPDHLQFDPRRMDFGEYLYRPLHQFANSDAASQTAFGSAERTCSSCHDAASTHTWLPYAERHLDAVNCETCHVPTLYGAALEYVDWTALTADGTPLTGYRGLDGDVYTGFTPVLLPDEDAKLTPYNLVSAWFWVYGDPVRPVPLADLEAAWLVDGAYAPEILAAFDADGSGALDETELRLTSDDKVALLTSRLAALGLDNPRIQGEVTPYAIHHNVAQGEWATRECHTCHGEQSRLNAPMTLISYLPGGAQPTMNGSSAPMGGSFTQDVDGLLRFQPATDAPPTNLYVLGHDSVVWIDALGLLMFFGAFAVALGHGGLRWLSMRRMAAHAPPQTKQVYMYSIYERQWHWLQTAAIFGLLFTGLVIHRPTTFSMFDYGLIVTIHNALAVLLVINAALSAFYHFVSGEIRQFLPRPYGFFDQAFAQAKYYLRGIFRGDPHPFEKTADRKMNPLQQMTYLAILNVLLPLQIITGALMWAAPRLPELTEQLGGLPFLAPFHTLIAWLFATFIVVHVYLTTTGHTPMANIKAMMLGWDEVETHQDSTPSAAKPEGSTAS